MLDTLLESRALTQRSASGTAFSLFAHFAIIGGAVLATQQQAVAAFDPHPEQMTLVMPPNKPPTPVDPPHVVAPTTPQPRGFQLVVAPIEIPNVLPPIDLTQRVTDPDDYSGKNGVAGGWANGDSTVRGPIKGPSTYYEFQVEKPASLIMSSANPPYPETLKNAGIEGTVLVSFVIDTTGRADMSTFKVMKSDHPLFTESVRNALPRMRFLPAEVGGKKVAQFAQMPFVFSLR